MKRSNRLILLIGFFLAAVAFVAVVMLLGSGGVGGNGNEPGVDALNTTIVVTTTDVPLGTTLTADPGDVGLQQKLARDAEDDFNKVFGREFMGTYMAQVKRLRGER